jgi:hypothetical protein
VRAAAAALGRRPPFAFYVVAGSLVVLVALVSTGHTVKATPVILLTIVLSIGYQRLLSWRALLGLTVLTILFVPIKRYTLPASLPFNLELYRLVVAIVFVAWLTSLLIDRRVRFRASGFEAPLLAFILVIVLSLVVNTSRANAVGRDLQKGLTFFASYFLVFYLVVSLLRSARDIDFLAKLLAGGGAVLGFFAVFESATHFNVFNHLKTVLPIMNYDASQAPVLFRGAIRAYGSGQHPIAFGAALAVLLPFAVYRAWAFGQRRWWGAAGLILLGLLASRSRTGILMLLIVVLVFVVLRLSYVKRLWPAIIPAMILIHFALPGALGTIKSSFFPSGTTIIQQQQNAQVGSGRLATLGPALDHEFKRNPILGEGFGTRVVTPDANVAVPNGPILDDQWLGVLLETGVAGTLAFVWIFVRAMRRMGRLAKRDYSPRGWLLVATTAGVAAYGVGMFTYDSFSFIQVTFLFWIVLAIGAAAVLSKREEWEDLAAGSGQRGAGHRRMPPALVELPAPS